MKLWGDEMGTAQNSLLLISEIDALIARNEEVLKHYTTASPTARTPFLEQHDHSVFGSDLTYQGPTQ